MRTYLMADRGDGRIVCVESRASFKNGREDIRWPREGWGIRTEPRAWWEVEADSADAARQQIAYYETAKALAAGNAFTVGETYGRILASGGAK